MRKLSISFYLAELILSPMGPWRVETLSLGGSDDIFDVCEFKVVEG